MDADEYQELAMRTAGEASTQQDALLLSALGLCGEAGEVADIVKKVVFHSHPLDIGKLRKEAGDVAWYLARLCTAMDWELSGVLAKNIEKLSARYPEGFDPERSLHREGEQQ